MLYLVEFADWDCQAKIGYGVGDSEDQTDATKRKTGKTDSMTYHTGTTATSRTTFGRTQYRHIEGMWDLNYEWIDGLSQSANICYAWHKPTSYGTTNDRHIIINTLNSYISGMIKSFTSAPPQTAIDNGLEYAIFPDSVNSGTSAYYVCDYFTWDNSANGWNIATGSNMNNLNQMNGMFRIQPIQNTNGASGRMQYLPFSA